MKLTFLVLLIVGQALIQTEGAFFKKCFGTACESLKSFLKGCVTFTPPPKAIMNYDNPKSNAKSPTPPSPAVKSANPPPPSPAVKSANPPPPSPATKPANPPPPPSPAAKPANPLPPPSPAVEPAKAPPSPAAPTPRSQTQSVNEAIIPLHLEDNVDVCIRETAEDPVSKAEQENARGLFVTNYVYSYTKGIEDRTIPYMRGVIMPLRQKAPTKDPWSLESYAETCLRLHNKYRQIHHAGRLSLNGNALTNTLLQRRINQMALDKANKFSKQIATFADKVDIRPDSKEVGNVYYTSSSSAEFTGEEIISMAIEYWYAQAKHYKDYGEVSPYKRSTQNIDEFTAMVWRSSTSMGLGVSKHTDSKTNLTYYVAVVNYYPPGNIRGQYHINVKAENDTNIEPLSPFEKQISAFGPILNPRSFRLNSKA